MRLLLDMNIPPGWVKVLAGHGFEALHWSEVGHPGATDAEVMAWAQDNHYVVFTHDLDFSALLAATGATAPSVIQVRAQDLFAPHIQQLVVNSLKEFRDALLQGALISVEPGRSRVRVLPFNATDNSTPEPPA
jgi:predicted nuclease of predicted toxin-antitoxin system